ncbi:P-loop ATPase, Sll1717 family [Streptococcus infantis]|uniref:P-loop ATPase, Sll1717 family n=1 Tax=Streptococcus infantis TaxID=68892 RepID=UPI0039C1C6D7
MVQNEKKFKKVSELRTLSTNADDFNEARNKLDEKLFDRVFLKDEFYELISNQNTYFIVGEKGSGKTAYAVYYCNNKRKGIAELNRVPPQMFYKFIGLKQRGQLENTPYHEIWENVIMMMILSYIKNDLKKNIYKRIFYKKKIDRISSFIEKFHRNAYDPNFQAILDVVQSYTEKISSELSAKLTIHKTGVGSKINGESGEQNTSTSHLQKTSMALTELFNESKQLFEKVNFSKTIDFFIDGIDILPENVDYEVYKACIEGLANAVANLNSDKKLRSMGVRICLLIRPDLLFDMKLYNGGQILKNNTVYLKWETADKNYRQGLLFRLADNYLSKQQDKPSKMLGETWDHYFSYPYKPITSPDKLNSFVQFLYFSNYKPRDILTLLNLVIEKNKNSKNKDIFSKKDLKRVQEEYHDYLKTELADYMSVYISRDELKVFDNFLRSLNKLGIHKKFTYPEFVDAYNNSNISLQHSSNKLSSPDYLLQLMFDANLICYFDTITPEKDDIKHWSLKEKGYSNMMPNIELNVAYQFHNEYANAYNIKYKKEK